VIHVHFIYNEMDGHVNVKMKIFPKWLEMAYNGQMGEDDMQMMILNRDCDCVMSGSISIL